jgi:hypothetical protein
MTRRKTDSLSAPLAGGFVLLAALLGAATSAPVQAGSDSGRAESGARLFRAMLAADTEIERKVDADGALRVLLVHAGDAERAASLSEIVEGREAQRSAAPIRGLPVRHEIVRVDDLANAGKRGVSGVFIAEPMRRDRLNALIRFGAERRVLVFSPFEGDVENGVAGGLSIEAQVRLYVNTQALRASQVTLKEFFLKAAKVYP